MNRIQKIQNQLRSQKLNAVLVYKPQNVRYLCGFTGTNGQLLITPRKVILMTDFRYFRVARKQIPKSIEIVDGKKEFKTLLSRFKVVGFEERYVTYSRFQTLKKALPKVRLKSVGDMVDTLRMIKDVDEIRIIKKACKIADECLKRLTQHIKVGVSEDELEWHLLSIARDLGADGFSFDPIICFGKNTADVHHQKEPNRFKKGEMVLIDMGITYRGYMTDMTRVFFTKPLTEKQKQIYEIVLEANEKAIASIAVGKKLSEIDCVARDVIKKAGYGDRFGHSTGHGVGLEIHEMPAVSSESDIRVQPGMVFTIEPGIYLDSFGGVRIEDMVYVNEKGRVEVLTKSPKKQFFIAISNCTHCSN